MPLIPPFAAYWATVPEDFRLNLLLYLAVMAFSAVFCVDFLAIHPSMRLFSRTRQTEGAELTSTQPPAGR
jgi:hypothetical protein